MNMKGNSKPSSWLITSLFNNLTNSSIQFSKRAVMKIKLQIIKLTSIMYPLQPNKKKNYNLKMKKHQID